MKTRYPMWPPAVVGGICDVLGRTDWPGLRGGISLALTGPGRYSVDHRLPVLRDNRLDVGAGAIALGAVTAAVVLLIHG